MTPISLGRMCLLIPVLLSQLSCIFSSRPRPERWLLPDGYKGWARLDYAIPGAPPLPREGQAWLVRIPASGHLQTSTSLDWTHSERDTEFFYDSSRGRVLLQHGYGDCPECQVQSSSLVVPHGNPPNHICRCVYIGNRAEYMNARPTCEDKLPDPRNP